ncbi:DUF2339 domain-containing protein [Sphingomonas gilva]|uniref:DUF2339 domain-containing protein n=1 Tax=Sphingomonas gilva TaxID=2305907 RepID=UPI0015FB57A8|nr:DUF2339 domain-containing protein [Sphingomonas gilva]
MSHTTITETFENLVGGRLPIWIGGAALVLAGFFFVRYAIEAGLLGPAARAVIAAIFGLALVAASEAARRLHATADDPRIAQALAGAGVASLYGTLYMAGELYGLIGGLSAFVLMLLVTGLALGLSVRHGPPTAIMGLIGGFAAPLVTGYSESNLVPLLIYLALFTAALFGLAIARGWAWLALAASGAGFAWSAWLIAVIDGDAAAAIGPFILILAIGAAFALPRLEGGRPIVRAAPLLLGLVQLLMLAPRLEFSPLAWALYAMLAGAVIILAARDLRLTVAAGAAGALALLLLAIGLANGSPSAPAAALVFALLFAGAGHALMGRPESHPAGRATWTLLALGGSAGPFLLSRALWAEPVSDGLWALLAVASAVPAALVAWRCRESGQTEQVLGRAALGHLGGPAVAALLIIVGFAPIVTPAWTPVLIAFVMLALALWARLVGRGAIFALPAIAWGAALLAAAEPLADYAWLVFRSLTGLRIPFRLLPDLADALTQLAIPATIAAALLAFDARQFARARWLVAASAAAIAVLLAYTFAKLPLAIASPEAFLAMGFTERAALTQALFAAAWLLGRSSAWRMLAAAIAAVALARIVWFDLLLLNPLLVRQAVGPIILLNAAVLHAAAATIWLWLLSRILPASRSWRLLSLAGFALTALVIVRQASHGSILTGPFGQGETWLYSAALLAVSVAWLAHGIHTGARDLRIAGLALLTLVTFKVFLIDAAALEGLLRILSLLGLGIALIAIGWAYGKVLRRPAASSEA